MPTRQLFALGCVVLTMIAVAAVPPVTGAQNQKLKPEELIAKHLASLGPAEKRQTATTRATIGTVQVVFRVGGNGTLNGKGNILSQGNSVRAGFGFAALEYPGEQIAFDGNKVTAGQMSPGNYPPFAGFLYEHNALLKEGLLFGALSTGWSLLDVAANKPKLDATGLKKVDGRQLQELKYSGRNTKENMQAFLYFDPETFRHVRSQFRMELPATRVSRIGDTAELVRYQINEWFDDFKEVDGLMLPHSYKLDFTVDGPRGGMLTTWDHVIQRITHNEALERELFSVR